MTDDDQLRRLLSDAVNDIEPQDRLAQIRGSVRSDPKVVPMSRQRSWIPVVGVAAAVAVIGGVAFAAGALQSHNDAGPGPAGQSTSSHHTTAPVTPPSSSGPTTPTSATPGLQTYAVYYVGDGPGGGPVLYREFHSGAGSSAAIPALRDLASVPMDPDYRTPWHAGDLARVSTDTGSGTIDVTLGSDSVRDRPAGMSAAEARAAVQQVVYTVQAAYQKRLPVRFTWHGTPIDHVFGVPTSQPIANAPLLKTLSLVSISSPNEGQQVSGRLTVTGVNNAFEGTSVVYLERNGKKYLTTPVLGGFGGDKLYPWTATLKISTIPPAKYTLVAENPNASGRGTAPRDTRTIIVK